MFCEVCMTSYLYLYTHSPLIAGKSGISVNGHIDCVSCVFTVPHVQKVISRTFEALGSQVKAESLVLSLSSSPVFLWPNKGGHATAGEISPNRPCKDLQQLIQ